MDAVFQTTYSNGYSWMKMYEFRIKFHWSLFLRSINNIPALAQIMAWHRSSDKPLSGPMMVSLPTHTCVTRPQWVKESLSFVSRDLHGGICVIWTVKYYMQFFVWIGFQLIQFWTWSGPNNWTIQSGSLICLLIMLSCEKTRILYVATLPWRTCVVIKQIQFNPIQPNPITRPNKL